MFLFLGLALLTLLRVSSALAHDPFVLDARRALPGSIRLELIEVPSGSALNGVSYRLQAFGVPQQIHFGLFTKDFSHSFHEIASGFHVDDFGNLASIDSTVNRRQRLDEMVLAPGPYPMGAAWEVALVSTDRTIRAFAKAIPRPVTARDGTCTVSLELVSQRGDRFIVSGGGFFPGDEVITESRYSGRVIQKRQQISADGILPSVTISHGSRGTDRSARYMVKGQSCEVVLDYQWGEPALIRR
jgi:hypothetical protein